MAVFEDPVYAVAAQAAALIRLIYITSLLFGLLIVIVNAFAVGARPNGALLVFIQDGVKIRRRFFDRIEIIRAAVIAAQTAVGSNYNISAACFQKTINEIAG